MRNSTRQPCAAVLAVVFLSLAVSGCGSGNGGAASHDIESQTQSSSTGDDEQADGSAEGRNPATKEAAERYRDCLEAAGIGADIVDDNWVVFTAESSQGSVSSTDSDDTDNPRQQAIEQCQAKVPDYHDPDFNTK